MTREQYILQRSQGYLGLESFFLYYSLLGGNIGREKFFATFPMFYQAINLQQNNLNQDTLRYLDVHFKVNFVIDRNGNYIMVY